MDNSLLSRKRRGAVNIIGNAANALFGVLDSNYAEKISQTIQSMENNEEFLLTLIKNQTSVIDSTLNIVKNDEEQVEHKLDRRSKASKNIQNHITGNEKIVKDQFLLQSLLSIAIHLMLITSNLRRIGPLLLSPNQLKNEMTMIKGHLPPTLRFPVNQEDLISLYKYLSVGSAVTKNHILFQIQIPLIGINEFNIYKLIPIASLTNGSFISIQPTTDMLAVTAHGDKYFPMTEQQHNNCVRIKLETYLCPFTQSLFNKGAKANACEINLFNNETRLACKVTERTTDQWIQLNNKNQWIFGLQQPTKLTAVCGDETSQLTIHGSGLLQMNPDCIVKNEHFTLVGHQTFNNTILASLTTHGHWSHLQSPETAKPIQLEDAIDTHEKNIKDLMSMREAIKGQQLLNLPHKFNSTSQHVFSVSSTALALAIMSTIYIVIKRYWPLNQPNTKSTVPVPTPRNHDFSIHV